MRIPTLLAALAIASLPAICAAQDDSSTSSSDGQDNAIHAVTAIHYDGTRTVTITDPDKHTT